MLQSMHSTDTTIHKLCIRPTGGGKSLLFTILAACLRHITLYITPLLSLGTYQTIKHQWNTTSNRSELNSVHLDEIPKEDMTDAIISYKSNADFFSIIVCSSPQSLVTKDGLSKYMKF